MTHAEAKRIWKWASRALGIGDWTAHLWLDERPPAWAEVESNTDGAADWQREYKLARIWVKVPGREPGQTLMHEIGHVAFADVGAGEVMSEPAGEHLLNQLAAVLWKAYQRDARHGSRKARA